MSQSTGIGSQRSSEAQARPQRHLAREAAEVSRKAREKPCGWGALHVVQRWPGCLVADSGPKGLSCEESPATCSHLPNPGLRARKADVNTAGGDEHDIRDQQPGRGAPHPLGLGPLAFRDTEAAGRARCLSGLE